MRQRAAGGSSERGSISRLALAVALGLASTACVEDAPGAVYEVSGIVSQESEDGERASPLGGALVRFTSDTGHVSETTSGDDGRYEMQVFTDVRFGQVRAERDGFAPDERTVLFDQPQRRIDLRLRPVRESR